MSKLCGSLDANTLLRLILNDIPAQSAAVASLIDGCRDGFLVSDLAIVEVEYALRVHYSFSREQVTETLGVALLHPSIHHNRSLMDRVFALYSSHPKLSFTDCCLALRAEVDDAKPLWTFDKKLAGQSAETARLIEV